MSICHSSIFALITCGGNSERMGNAKALLNYHGMPQYQWLLFLCKQLAMDAAISCKAAQRDWYEANTPILLDDENLGFTGPMLSLLSSMNQTAEKPIFLLGCDYPLLNLHDIEHLINTFEKENKTCAIYSEETLKYEPVLAIYHPKDFKKLQEQYLKKEFSLQVYLHTIEAFKVYPKQAHTHKSFDTPEDFLNFRELRNA
jgi:molybdenum cofactor guanylyltransferase